MKILTRVVIRQRSSPRGNKIIIATFSECHSKFKVKVIRQKLWFGVKGLFTRNTHVKYESTISHGSYVMTKVKVFEK